MEPANADSEPGMAGILDTIVPGGSLEYANADSDPGMADIDTTIVADGLLEPENKDSDPDSGTLTPYSSVALMIYLPAGRLGRTATRALIVPLSRQDFGEFQALIRLP